MSFYSTCIVPHLVHLAMRNRRLLPYREQTISAAEGRVLEIAIGSGLNLAFYSRRVKELIGLEPAAGLISMTHDHAIFGVQMHFVAILVGHPLSFLPIFDQTGSDFLRCLERVVGPGIECSEPAEVALDSDYSTLKVAIASLTARLTLGQ